MEQGRTEGGRGVGATRTTAGGAVVTAVAFLAVVGCSSEDREDRVAENAIERSLEADGQDGDVDVDLDNGAVRIETPDGSAAFNEAGEGNISIEGEGDDAQIDVGGGRTVLSTPDGEMVIGVGELPDTFPASVPLPERLAVESVVSMDGDGATAFTVSGKVPADVATATGEYLAALEAAGFAQQSLTQTSDGSFFEYAHTEWRIGGGFYNDAGSGSSIMSLSVHREP